jgi:hypothetical protein
MMACHVSFLILALFHTCSWWWARNLAKMVNRVSTNTPCHASQCPKSLSFIWSKISWHLTYLAQKLGFFINEAAFTPCRCSSRMASSTQKSLLSTNIVPVQTFFNITAAKTCSFTQHFCWIFWTNSWCVLSLSQLNSKHHSRCCGIYCQREEVCGGPKQEGDMCIC